MIKVGLDIGNSKISCIVCDIKTNAKPKILSFVSSPTSNINKNNFINFNKIISEVQEVINISSRESETEIKSINLTVPLISTESFYYNSKILIDSELITDLHIKKAINQSSFFDEIIHKKILMNFILSYRVDENIIFNNPVGNYANKLNINFYKLLIDQNILSTYENLFNELNIHIENFVPKPLASALATLNKDDQDLGGICIDLGNSSTSIALFEYNTLIFCDAINIGSANITNDIARGI